MSKSNQTLNWSIASLCFLLKTWRHNGKIKMMIDFTENIPIYLNSSIFYSILTPKSPHAFYHLQCFIILTYLLIWHLFLHQFCMNKNFLPGFRYQHKDRTFLPRKVRTWVQRGQEIRTSNLLVKTQWGICFMRVELTRDG